MRYRGGCRGFTLVELLMVIAIVGVLAVIAQWAFFGAKDKAYCASVLSDLKSLATAEEAYLSENGAYLAVTSGPGNQTNLVGIYLSPGVVVESSAADATGFTLVASHPRCDRGPITFTERGPQ